MARSTCNPNVDVPKGMQKFEVIRTTIRDNLGQYCAPGDMAILDKKHAKAYLSKNYIRVALPDFDEDVEENDDAEPASSEAKDTSSQRPRKGRARASSDS